MTGHAIPADIQPRRAGDPATLIEASGRIADELGWPPKYLQLKDIIQTAWNWHQANPEGFRD